MPQSLRPHGLTKEEDIAGGLGAKPQSPVARRAWGRSPQTPTDFHGFHIKKQHVLAHFLIEKGHTDTCSECSHYYSVR